MSTPAEPARPARHTRRPHPARRIDRLVSLGTVVVDLICIVPALPEPGGDVFGSGGQLVPGGGFTAMAAARRGGLPTVHAGSTGTGPFGDLVRAALDGAGIETVVEPIPGLDTGVCVVLVDATAERTFVTVPGAEGRFEPAMLARFPFRDTDAVLVSGYGLVHPVTRRSVLGALAALPAGATLVVDPGPLGHELGAAVLEALFARADWFTCNAREATLLTGLADPQHAAAALAERLAGTASTGRSEAAEPEATGSEAGPELDPAVDSGAHHGRRPGHAVVRIGSAGCLLAVRGRAPVVVPAAPASVVSTNGAGDTHTGALLAALAAGLTPVNALRQANESARDFLRSREP